MIRDCDKGFIGYGEFFSFGAGLCCLHGVDVLWNTFGLAEIIHNFTLDDDGINLMEATQLDHVRSSGRRLFHAFV